MVYAYIVVWHGAEPILNGDLMMAKIAKKIVKDDSIVFEFVNGTVLEYEIADLDMDITHRLALHGLSQKLGDSYAGAETVDEAVGTVKTLWDQLLSGVWATRAARGGIWVEALARVTGESYEDCLQAWMSYDEEKQKELKKHPQMVEAHALINAERAQAKVTKADSAWQIEL